MQIAVSSQCVSHSSGAHQLHPELYEQLNHHCNEVMIVFCDDGVDLWFLHTAPKHQAECVVVSQGIVFSVKPQNCSLCAFNPKPATALTQQLSNLSLVTEAVCNSTDDE